MAQKRKISTFTGEVNFSRLTTHLEGCSASLPCKETLCHETKRDVQGFIVDSNVTGFCGKQDRIWIKSHRKRQDIAKNKIQM